jgi:uncharacterized protein YlxP (DUF503 family)
MHVAILRFELGLTSCESLRQKRRTVPSIVAKLRKHFNVAAAEVDHLDRPDAALLAFAAVDRSRRLTHETLERVADALRSHPHVERIGHAIIDL